MRSVRRVSRCITKYKVYRTPAWSRPCANAMTTQIARISNTRIETMLWKKSHTRSYTLWLCRHAVSPYAFSNLLDVSDFGRTSNNSRNLCTQQKEGMLQCFGYTSRTLVYIFKTVYTFYTQIFVSPSFISADFWKTCSHIGITRN